MTTKTLLRAAAAAASAICLLAGLWIVYNAGLKPSNALVTGIGLYFIGKAFFVGPMLLAAAEQLSPRQAAARP